MKLLIVLVVLNAVLAMAAELSYNFRDQWVPQWQTRLTGQTSPAGVMLVGIIWAAISVVAAAVAFAAGWLFGGETWGWAWSTLAAILVCVPWPYHTLNAISDGKKWKHPKNPKSPFWP